MDNQLINNLNQIIEQKLDLFSELYDITVMQQQDIDNNEADNIETLVQQKQLIIDKIDQLDQNFLKGYETLKTSLNLDKLEKTDTSKYPELRNLKESVERIMELAPEIMKLENNNREKLNAIFDKVKNELKQVKAGKKSIKAYEAAPVYNDGIYIDKKK